MNNNRVVSNIADLKFKYAIKDIERFQNHYESIGFSFVDSYFNNNNSSINSINSNSSINSINSINSNNITKLNILLQKHYKNTIRDYWLFSDYLLMKYSDGFLSSKETHGAYSTPGYPYVV